MIKTTKTTTLSRRIRRELKTVRVMIEIHCRDRHGTGRYLCNECRDLWDYAKSRVERCPFRPDKPTCLNCTVHCFKKGMRERVRSAMRTAGPKMPWRHPVLSLFHVLDGRKPPHSRRRGSSPPRQ